MSLTYALMDSSPVVTVDHLKAALAVWDYCEASVRFTFGKAKMDVTISIGYAVFPDDGTTREELVQKADQALYRAKESGRNCVVY